MLDEDLNNGNVAGLFTNGSELLNTGVLIEPERGRYLAFSGDNLDLCEGTSIRFWVQPQVDPYAQPTPEWHGDKHPEPPAEEEIEEPYEQPTPAFPPPPVATNGHSHDHDEVSARSTTVALVDAGPFVDLIELRHFEDDLASLTAVRDVRVRRFGHGRASIEVGMTGPYALSRELYRLGRPMRVSDGDEGDLVIDLAPAPGEAEEATEEAQEPADEWTPGTPEAEG